MMKNQHRSTDAFRFQLLRALFCGLLLLGAMPVVAAPVITGFTPAFGRPGTQVTITGSGFTDAVRVEFGIDRNAAFVRINAGQINAIVPEDGLSGPLRVYAAGGSSGASAATFYVAPRIEDFHPRSGSTTTTVTVEGANFIPGFTQVVFGSVTSTVVNVTASTQLRAGVPAGFSNAVIHVITGAGAATSRVDFVSTTSPSIEEFAPLNGLAGKGVSVVIDGANFTGASAVSFNGKPSPFTVTSDTQISTTVPAGATSGKISVTTPNGVAQSLSDFVVGPTVEEFNPPSGGVGDLIVISGNDFTGITNVTFGGTNTSQLIITAMNQVHARVPTGAKSGLIGVHTTTGEGYAATNFVVGPLITGFEPDYGPVGTPVVISGGGFVGGTGTTVKFGTITAASPFVSPPTQVTANVPTGATNAPLVVSTAAGTNVSTRPFLVTTSVPLITTVTPASAPPGTEIQIRGAKFQNAIEVTIGGRPAAFQVTADTLILATVPAGVLTGPVRVRNAAGTGVSPQTFYAPPWITSFTPTNGVVGTFVQIRGTNFTGLETLYFGGEPATISSITAAEILALVPLEGRTGSLRLETPGGSFVTTNHYRVLPKILSAQPQIGPVGSLVRIGGTSFIGATNVAFNGVSATFTNLTTQVIDAVVPAGATTGPIRVSTPDGSTNSSFSFTVTVPADLALTEVLSTNLVVPGTTVTYLTTITNPGPSIQTGVTLTNSFQTGLTLGPVTPSQGGCTIAGGIVSCSLGIVSNGQSATVSILANPPTSGVFTNLVTVRSIEGDPAPENNSAQNTLAVATIEQRTLGIELLSAPTRTVVWWPFSGVPFRLESNTELGNANVPWVGINGGIPQNNSIFRYTNTANQPQVFFRLQFP